METKLNAFVLKIKGKLKVLTQKIKGSFKSKTVWFNAVLASLIPLLPELINAIPELQPYLPADTYKILTLIGVLGNLYLRTKTNKALESK